MFYLFIYQKYINKNSGVYFSQKKKKNVFFTKKKKKTLLLNIENKTKHEIKAVCERDTTRYFIT